MKDGRANPTFATQDYRGDGWPLCPSCGEDELMSGEIPARADQVLQCLSCSWRGTVPLSSRGAGWLAHRGLL